MKKSFVLPLVAALSIFCSCQKQQTEAERQAEVQREVQRQLDAEHQAQEKEQLAQRQSDLDAREKALANQESAAKQQVETETRTAEPLRAAPTSQRPTGSYSTFYTKLEPYGDWRETSDYGYVWQPREAQSRNWRPYTSGRWVYTDAGWTWVSEEPFGWATYHYGRWTRLRNIGWVWVPGDEWAPAWVSWRKSDDYVGWAPLPPEARFDRRSGIHNWSDSYYDIGPDQYCFVATKEFGGERLERRVVPPERNITIVNQTTNVTNITYNNTTIVNQGPSYDELRVRTQQPIQRLRLEREVNVNVNVGEPRPVVRGEVIVIPAPLIARGPAIERPRAVKETIAHVEIDRGWEGIADRQAAEKTRAKMKSEATPPLDAPPKTFVKPAQAPAEASAPPATSTSTSTAAPPPQPPAVTATAPPAPSATITPIQPARVTQTPERSATAVATGTPFPRATPVTTPNATTTPTSRETATTPPRRATLKPQFLGTPPRRMSPSPTAAPASPMVSPQSSASPASEISSTPSVTPTSSAGGDSAETQDRRKAQRELKKQSQPTLTTGSASPVETRRKEEKRNRKKAVEESSESPSPTPSAQ